MTIHRHRFAVILIILVIVMTTTHLTLGQTPITPQAAAEPAGAFKSGEILVRFKTDTASITTQQTLDRYNVTPIRSLYSSDVRLMQVPAGREVEIAKALSADPGVDFAEPNYRYYAFDTTPNDPHFGKQWAHTRMQSEAAWDVSTGNSSITIAIIDSGVDLGHPDLAGKLVAGHDFVDDDNTPSDANGHGTHVAGIAAAVTNNATGIAGTSWGAKIMPVRVLDAAGSGYNADITDGMTWAYQHGADILNLSLGGTTYSQAMQNAVNAAHTAGSLIVAAMGNCRNSGPSCPTANPVTYPAAYDNVFAVSATDSADTYANYSQYGTHCDIAAPGGEMTYYGDPGGIFSTMPTYAVYLTSNYGYLNNYDRLQGTSQASPHVAGLAALVWSVVPTLTHDEVQNVIEQTADDLGPAGWDQNYGWGRINAYTTLTSVAVPDAPVLSPINNSDGDDTYTVTWSTIPNVVSYTLQQSNAANFYAPITRYTGPDTQLPVTAQDVGTWYYRVRVTNAYGNSSAWSTIESVAVHPAAPVPSPITNPTNADAYTVAWAPVAGADRYILQQDITPGFMGPVTRYIGTDPAYGVTGQPGGMWYYRVQAAYKDLLSPWSTPVSTTVDPALLLPPNIAVLSDDGDGDYTLDWSEVVSATVYTLEESLDPYFTNPLVVYDGATTVYTATARDGGRWSYRVRAAGPEGRSPWSETSTVVVLRYVYLPMVLKNYIPQPPTGDVPNGDFESGMSAWTVQSTQERDVITDTFPTGIDAHGGDWAAWLGGVDDESVTIQQPVTITAAAPYLTYWYWINSTDICGYDLAEIIVNATTVQTYDLCSSANTGNWVETSLDLSAHTGVSVTLVISTSTDFTSISSLYIDDITLQATP